MIKDIIFGGAVCALVWASYRLGWESAHQTVATECQRLGKFYVGKKTYHCTVIEDKADEVDKPDPNRTR
ncbi:hypothetical protein [Yersinia ruckeri]|uniref:hypothetical protein n=1 Tax=Yersinia ruckeri TaxID=29486 RepID=UPI0008FE9DF3|nr:hypothetical protein [Yersinia ruckeri]OJB95778.1 hypothetical protein AXW59_07495 [Yersinia ruckeri]OJB98579.1 hypothetical protein AXW58_07475 [Yersinia ruckeri]OJC00227.1 hypothetical protein AXW57_07490 [Yersinia ruckeri]